jgi:hypothetical protein
MVQHYGILTKHHRANPKDDASNNHLSALESSCLDDATNHDDNIGEDHSPFAAKLISKRSSNERSKYVSCSTLCQLVDPHERHLTTSNIPRTYNAAKNP